MSGTCAQETPHKLVGVTIVGERRVALFEDARPGSGGARFLPLGATVAGYRLVDIQDDHVTLEGSDGERTILRLGAGAAVGQPPSTAHQRASEIERTRAVQVKEERHARRAEENARAKASARTERERQITE